VPVDAAFAWQVCDVGEEGTEEAAAFSSAFDERGPGGGEGARAGEERDGVVLDEGLLRVDGHEAGAAFGRHG